MSLLPVLLLSTACHAGAPLPEGNAFVRALVGAQRRREESVSRYTYDVVERRERLDRDGRVSRRRLEEGAWLPRSMEASATGKNLLFHSFRVRTTTSYENHRRFEVDVQEDVRP